MTKKQKHLENDSLSIIIGPMPFPFHFLKKYLLPTSKLIFIDGGTVHQEKFKMFPTLLEKSIVAGDGDSSKKKMILRKNDQNQSDLSYVLKNITTENTIYLAGFLGGRRDHELANFGEIHSLLEKNKHITQLFMDDKIIFFNKGSHTLSLKGSFSLLSLKTQKIKLTGHCSYPLPKWHTLTPLSSRGLSNMGNGEIKISTNAPLMLLKN